MEIPYTGKMAFIILDGPGSHKCISYGTYVDFGARSIYLRQG